MDGVISTLAHQLSVKKNHYELNFNNEMEISVRLDFNKKGIDFG